jgi:tetratricopeptide (TPR) repeat protein
VKKHCPLLLAVSFLGCFSNSTLIFTHKQTTDCPDTGLISCARTICLGSKAEDAGNFREAIVKYTWFLQNCKLAYVLPTPNVPFSLEGRESRRRTREHIIKLALKLRQPPAVSERAEQSIARGQAMLQEAKTQGDFESAAHEFEHATWEAPWWSSAYFAAGIAEEQAGWFGDAIENLQLYLLAAPTAQDAGDVKARILKLEQAKRKGGR